MDENERFKRLEDKMENIVVKIDNVTEHLNSMDKNLAVYNEQLKVHISGTVDNRESIKQMNERIEPIEDRIVQLDGVVKFIGFLGLIAALVLTIIQIYG